MRNPKSQAHGAVAVVLAAVLLGEAAVLAVVGAAAQPAPMPQPVPQPQQVPRIKILDLTPLADGDFTAAADRQLLDLVPRDRVIRDAATWKKLVAGWKLKPELADAVDFDKLLVLVGTTSGSSLRLSPVLSLATGELSVGLLQTRDLQPGFRFKIVAVARAGVLSVGE